MSHQLHDYLAKQIEQFLPKRRVVVFYDARSEFEPFIDEFVIVETGIGGLSQIRIGDTLTHLARFDGSFFALKASIEPLVSADNPEALLVYVPGQVHDSESSVLMEVECAGKIYGDAPAHALKSIARRLLRQQYTDGDIDGMLRTDSLSYHDVVRYLDEGGSGSGSVLKLVLTGSSSEALITDWIVSVDKDEMLASKVAEPELFRLIHARLGLEIEEGTPLTKARHQMVRYLLINEFRSDLSPGVIDALMVVPSPRHQDDREHIATVSGALRAKHGDVYVEWADRIQQEFDLVNANITPERLGAIDTFRFEERCLLHHAACLMTDGRYADSLAVLDERRNSFWLEIPKFIGRSAQWEACRLMAVLLAEIDEVRPRLKKTPPEATKWVEAYADNDGWYRIDRMQRMLEAWVTTMEDEPEGPLQQALALARSKYEAILTDMATGFTAALTASEWVTPGARQQTGIYSELVEPCSGRVAYVVVDAMRFEMGAELVEQLPGAQELQLQPAVAVLPSITPMGMAALLPGASSSFSVVEHQGKLASKIHDSVLPGARERLKLLKAVRPDSVEINLDDLLSWNLKKAGKRLSSAPLVVVRSQEIDVIGEGGTVHLARHIMNGIIGNIARAVRKLSKLGIERFVVTSDHGHQFSGRKTQDLVMDRPGGTEVDQHRRCWAGRGGQTPTAAVRVSGGELGYQTDLEFMFPRGLAVFRSGGDLTFHHGGCSLQEMVVPVITLRMRSSQVQTQTAPSIVVDGYPTTLTTRTVGCRLVFDGDLLAEGAIAARVVLIGDGQEVGRAGMAPDAEFDPATATVQLMPGKAVTIGMMLTKETTKTVRIVVQDPTTDAVLAQSEEIKVGELI